MENLDLNKVVVVIPCYVAPKNLLAQVDKLQSLGFHKIIVVDDGSPIESQLIFKKLKNIILLSNHVNKGKGEALKLAYQYILENYTDCIFAISCDDDGQHHPEDVLKVARAAIGSNLAQVYIGSRAFDNSVPLKSLIGNLSIEKMLFLFTGKHISDTQTGLRCIPISILSALIKIPSSKFNFEFASLLYLIKNKIPIQEISIRTIYFNNNRGTRFKGIRDSMSIIGALVKYIFN
ncbi:MAG: glycosyltransferase family 2 protein [Bacteriovorax sp.]|jgi:dolichol-phosphate mannosyltransferase